MADFRHPAPFVNQFHADGEVLVFLLGDLGHLGLHYVDALSKRAPVELLIALAEGADVHVVNGDLRVVELVLDHDGLLERIHAADPRTVGHTNGFVATSSALHVGNRTWNLAVGRTQDVAVGAVGGLDSLHGHGVHDVHEFVAAVLLLGGHGGQVKTGSQDHRPHFQLDLLRELGEVDAVRRADARAGPVEHAVLRIEHGNLRDGIAMRNVDGGTRSDTVVKFMRSESETGQLAEAATNAILLHHVTRLLGERHPEARSVGLHLIEFGVGKHSDALVVGHFRHARRANATAAIKGGKNLVEAHHHTADGWLFFHEQDVKALARKVKRRLHPGDARAHNQCVVAFTDHLVFHGSSSPRG